MAEFEILGLTSLATTDEVKKAWRKLAAIHHPDKGGDAAKFHELRTVYNRCLELAQLNDLAQINCPICNGTGKIDNPKQRGFYGQFKLMCQSCMGSGKRRS